MRMLIVAAVSVALLPSGASAQGANGKPVVPCRPSVDKVFTPGVAIPQKVNEMPAPLQILGVLRAFEGKCPIPVVAERVDKGGR